MKGKNWFDPYEANFIDPYQDFPNRLCLIALVKTNEPLSLAKRRRKRVGRKNYKYVNYRLDKTLDKHENSLRLVI